MKTEELDRKPNDSVGGEGQQEEIPIFTHPLSHIEQESEGGEVQYQLVKLGRMDRDTIPRKGDGPW